MKAVVDNITAFGVFGDELAKIAKGKTVDKIYELMNSAPIGKEAEYAEKFAEFVVENATTMVNGDEDLVNMQAESGTRWGARKGRCRDGLKKYYPKT